MAEACASTITLEQAQALAWIERRHACVLKIFGSVATGTAHARSDIDILVSGRVLGALQLHEISLLLTALFSREIDLVQSAKLFPFLRVRILQEARSAAQLAAGQFAAARAKSPYYYLYIIQSELHAVRRARVGTAQQQRQVMLRASRITHFYEQRFLPCSGSEALAHVPRRPLRALARIHTAWKYTQIGEREAVAKTRRLVRRIAKKLSLTPHFVQASVLAYA